MKIAIRADVNSIVATGHIKRDIAIALCLRKLGQECIFISADENCLPYLEPYGFETVILNSAWDKLEEEIPVLTEVIQRRKIGSLLVDSYQVTPTYMHALIQLTFVTYFDELGLFGYGCQQLINGVLEPPDYSNAPGRALLGPDYVSLREEFTQIGPKKISSRIEKVLVTTGGTDPYHFCVKFLERFLNDCKWRKSKVVATVGELSVDRAYLQEKYQEDDRVTILVNCNHMARVMQEVDYAVTAGGTTLYELCAAGVCSSSYAIADNQMEVTESFHRQGLVSCGGDFRNHPEETLDMIFAQMWEANEEAVRLERSRKIQRLVDGKGAMRIAKALIGVDY